MHSSFPQTRCLSSGYTRQTERFSLASSCLLLYLLKAKNYKGKRKVPWNTQLLYLEKSRCTDITRKYHNQKDKSVKGKIVKFASTLVEFIAQYIIPKFYHLDIFIHSVIWTNEKLWCRKLHYILPHSNKFSHVFCESWCMYSTMCHKTSACIFLLIIYTHICFCSELSAFLQWAISLSQNLAHCSFALCVSVCCTYFMHPINRGIREK